MGKGSGNVTRVAPSSVVSARAYLPRRNAASIMHTRGGDVN